MTKPLLRRRIRRDEAGIGLITVILVMSVVGALSLTATALTVNNVDNTRRDRQALAALATSEAGVAQAILRLRTGNLGALTCLEPAAGAVPGPTCTGATSSWTSATNPQQVRLDGVAGGCVATVECFKVWIGTVKPYSPRCAEQRLTPPQPCSGTYRVHALGVSGSGPGARKLAVDVKASPYSYPMGVFSELSFSGKGHVGIHAESLFTAGCMATRQDDAHSGSGTRFEYDSVAGRSVLDLFYDQPTAAHAVGNVSTSNNSCGSGSGGAPVHLAGPCNPTFRFDQDGSWTGASVLVPGDACYGKYVRADGSVYPTTSKFSMADLQSYGYRPRGLTDAQYDALKTQAQASGTYNMTAGSVNAALTNLLAAGVSSPVLYWDNGDVSLSSGDFPAAFLRALDGTAGCTTNSVTVVVAGASLGYSGGNSGPSLVSAMFVPDGTLSGRGGFNTIGTLFAKTVDLAGNPDFHVDECFVNNPPGATLDVAVLSFREDDNKDLN